MKAWRYTWDRWVKNVLFTFRISEKVKKSFWLIVKLVNVKIRWIYFIRFFTFFFSTRQMKNVWVPSTIHLKKVPSCDFYCAVWLQVGNWFSIIQSLLAAAKHGTRGEKAVSMKTHFLSIFSLVDVCFKRKIHKFFHRNSSGEWNARINNSSSESSWNHLKLN